MPDFDWLSPRAEVEMSCMSGIIRIQIQPKQPPVAILLEIGGFGWFTWIEIHSWSGPILHRLIAASVLFSATMAFLVFLTGQEVIEFDREHLTIRRSILGWEYVSRYAIAKCSQLTWRVQKRRDHYGLECKYGWRTITFARFASEEKSSDIIAFLQHEMPEIAEKMGSTPGGNSEHFVRLGLR